MNRRRPHSVVGNAFVGTSVVQWFGDTLLGVHADNTFKQCNARTGTSAVACINNIIFESFSRQCFRIILYRLVLYLKSNLFTINIEYILQVSDL